MNFATGMFLVFLVVVLAGYHALQRREYKYRFLLAASWLFYMSWSPWFIGVLLVTTLIDYWSGLLIESAATDRRKRLWLGLSIASNLGFLAVFKYTGFVVDNSFSALHWMGFEVPDWTVTIVLPLGISFHTFQGISYTIDVYRGKIAAVRSFVDFALFVAYFPQLVAGPIVRAVEFLPQMKEPPRVSSTQVVDGLHWFILGLFKKVFLADRLAEFVDAVFANPHAFDATTQRWAVLAYAAQIYCDFSGYSDLALGCSKWFGFELPQNFHFPYLSTSITEFWKRWHISLSTWMRDYLYISLGGSRHGSARTYFNLLLTMTLCGLWHGATWNYVLWGVYNGVLLLLHRLWEQRASGSVALERLRSHTTYRILAWAATFLLVAVGLVLVRSQSWAGCWVVEQSLLGMSASGEHWVPLWVPLLIGFVAVGHLFSGLRDVRCGLLVWPSLPRGLMYVAAIGLVIVFGPGSTRTFIYFQF